MYIAKAAETTFIQKLVPKMLMKLTPSPLFPPQAAKVIGEIYFTSPSSSNKSTFSNF